MGRRKIEIQPILVRTSLALAPNPAACDSVLNRTTRVLRGSPIAPLFSVAP